MLFSMTNELIWQAEVSLLLSEKDINYNTSMYDGWVASKSGSTLNVFSFLPEEVQK